MKASTIALIVAVFVVIAGIGWYMHGTNDDEIPNTPIVANPSSTGAVSATTTTATTTTTANTVTVTYGPSGFSPATVTVKQGDTVTFVNSGGDEMWVGSNPHPTHEGYDGTTLRQHCAPGYTGPAPFDQCTVGTTFSFTFTKVGTWGYHNHGNHADTGTVIVQ